MPMRTKLKSPQFYDIEALDYFCVPCVFFDAIPIVSLLGGYIVQVLCVCVNLENSGSKEKWENSFCFFGKRENSFLLEDRRVG